MDYIKGLAMGVVVTLLATILFFHFFSANVPSESYDNYSYFDAGWNYDPDFRDCGYLDEGNENDRSGDFFSHWAEFDNHVEVELK